MGSESEKHLHLTTSYLKGNGCDVGSGGMPVIRNCVSIDLPQEQYDSYTSKTYPNELIQYRGYGTDLPFKDGVLDFCYSSHLLEDYLDWWPPLREWTRVVKPGGYLIILVPDQERWQAALRRGQPPNCSHRHEARVGELSEYAPKLGLEVIEDRLCDPVGLDYSILFAGRKQSLACAPEAYIQQ